MKDILERLYKIVRSKTPNPEELVEKWLKKKRKSTSKKSWYNNFYKKWEKAGRSDDTSNSHSGNQAGSQQSYSQQLVDDLAAFGLTPPSWLDEVKKARNREVKKYHSDKFMNDPDKLESSKQIMQIFNAAYDRLKDYYESKDKGI